MKYIISLLLISFLISISCAAQVSWGVLGGVQQVSARVKITDGPIIRDKAGFGFHAGGTLKVNFDNYVFFAPQLLYSLKNFTVKYNNILKDSVGSSKISIHYIEIPALLQFDTRKDEKGFFFLFGPSFSVAISGREKRTFLDESEKKRAMRFAFTAYGRFEMNLLAKLGYRFQNNTTISCGYAYGLGSIVNDDYNPSVKPRMITLSAGYFFPGKL